MFLSLCIGSDTGGILANDRSILIFGILSAVFVAMSSCPVAAQDLSDLLKEADQALGKGERTAPPASQATAPVADEVEGKRRPKQRPVRQHQKPQTDAAVNAPATSEPPASALTPIDAASAQELMGIGLRREAKIKDTDRQMALSAGLAWTWLRGEFPLNKDDDNFAVANHQSLRGVSGSFSTDIGEHRWPGPFGGIISPAGRARIGLMAGRVQVERTGVQNQRSTVDDTLLGIAGTLGIRTLAWRQLQMAIGYGVSVDTLIQTGAGQSDSTSGLFTSDLFEWQLIWGFSKELALGLEYIRVGVMPGVTQASGQDTVIASLRLPLPG
jgi:hypothetical protein